MDIDAGPFRTFGTLALSMHHTRKEILTKGLTEALVRKISY